jgi:hypothetical protein
MATTTRPWVRMILRVGGDDPALESLITAMRLGGFVSVRKLPEGDWVVTWRTRSHAAADQQVETLRSMKGVRVTKYEDPNQDVTP